MAVLTALAVAATAVTVGGTVASISQAKKASRAQRDANAAQRKINRLRNKQAKRAFLRNFRQTQANALSASIAAGVGLESSLVQGILASESAQVGTALSEFRAFDKLGGEFQAAQDRASGAAFRSSAFGQVAAFASNFITFGGSAPTPTPTPSPGGGGGRT